MKYKIKFTFEDVEGFQDMEEIVEGDLVSTENGCLHILNTQTHGFNQLVKIYAANYWSTCEAMGEDYHDN